MFISRSSVPLRFSIQPENSAPSANTQSSVIVRNIKNCSEAPRVTPLPETHTKVEGSLVRELLLLKRNSEKIDQNGATQSDYVVQPPKLNKLNSHSEEQELEFDAVKALLLLRSRPQIIDKNSTAQAKKQDTKIQAVSELQSSELISQATEKELKSSNECTHTDVHKTSRTELKEEIRAFVYAQKQNEEDHKTIKLMVLEKFEKEISSRSIVRWSKNIRRKKLDIAKQKALEMKGFKNPTKIAKEVQVHPMTVRKWFKESVNESSEPNFQVLEREAVKTLVQFQLNSQALVPKMHRSKVKEPTAEELSSYKKLIDLPQSMIVQVKRRACDYIRIGMTHKDARIQTMIDFNVVISAKNIVSKWAKLEGLEGIRKEKIEVLKKYALKMKGIMPIKDIATKIEVEPKSVRQWFRQDAQKILKMSTKEASNSNSESDNLFDRC